MPTDDVSIRDYVDIRLKAAEQLELERVARLREEIDRVRSEVTVVADLRAQVQRLSEQLGKLT